MKTIKKLKFGQLTFEDCKVDVPYGKCRHWEVGPYIVSKEQAIRHNMRELLNGRPERRMNPGKYTLLSRNGRPIMTDTPAELLDLKEVIFLAHGNMLINGLGLGVLIDIVLRLGDVVHVTAIEKSRDVIALVKDHYLSKFPGKVEIVKADALKWSPPKGVLYDFVWHDIWDSISVKNREEMKFLHRKYGRRCKWQGSWCRPMIDKIYWEERKYGQLGAMKRHWEKSYQRALSL